MQLCNYIRRRRRAHVAAQCGDVGMDAGRTDGMRAPANGEATGMGGENYALKAPSGIQLVHSRLCPPSGDRLMRLSSAEQAAEAGTLLLHLPTNLRDAAASAPLEPVSSTHKAVSF